MKYRKLGRTGFEVSDISYGLWGMSGWSGSDDQQSLGLHATLGRSGLQFLRYGLGLWRRQERRTARRDHAAQCREAPLCGVENSSGQRQWPALPNYKYSDVFSAQHVFKYADKIRKQLQVDTIDVLQFHVWDDAGPTSPNSARRWRN